MSRKLPARCERENDIVFYGFPGQKLVEFLKNEDAIGPGRINHFSVEKNLALGGFEVTTDSFEYGGLPTSRRSENNVAVATRDRKSTRLNSSHLGISYAVFCLKQ